MDQQRRVSRRTLLTGCAACAASALLAAAHADERPTTAPAEPIIDIHQHTTYSGRPNDALFHHQKRMGVTQTILLPSGSPVDTPSTLKGKANGLYAGAGPIDTVIPIVQSHPSEYFFFANEV